jgi:hypothetical protein
MASELRVNTLKDAAGNNSIATSVVFNGTAKAWLNYNQSGNSVRDSYNISSTSDDGVGDKRYTLTSNMANANYSVTALVQGDNGDSVNRFINLSNFSDADNPTTSKYGTLTYAISSFSSFVDTDDDYTCTSIFGDLA